MKCVKDIKTGKVRRVSNERAEEMVKTGTHTYSSKGAWKSQGRKY